MKNEIVKAALEVMELGMRLNRPGFDVFVNYSGHVEQFAVRCYPYGSKKGGAVERYLYLDGTLTASPQQVRELGNWLQSLSSNVLCPNCKKSHPQPVEQPSHQRQPVEAKEATPEKRQGHPNVYTPEGKAELVAKTAEMRKAGKSIRQIAEELRIPIGTVSHLTWEYQIKGDGTVGGKREAA